MATIEFPVHITHPLTFEELLEMSRSVKIACIAFIMQERIVLRTRLSEAQNHRCCWCGRHMADTHGRKTSPTLEHVVPRSKGGHNGPRNLAVACARCNQKRGNKNSDAFLAHVHAVGWAHIPSR